MSRPRPPPWQDVPTCPNCESTTTVIPIEAAVVRGAVAEPPSCHRLFCVGCCQSYEGTTAEYDQAETAQMVWDSMRREMAKGVFMFDPQPKSEPSGDVN